MSDYCSGCQTKIRWYHRRDKHNGCWHHRCWDSSEHGYNAAKNFAEEENRIEGHDSPWHLYHMRTIKQNRLALEALVKLTEREWYWTREEL